MKRLFAILAPMLAVTGFLLSFLAAQQQPEIRGVITGEQRAPRIAIPDMPGPAAAAPLVEIFNSTLWNDLESAGRFEMVSKSFYPRTSPRRPEDLRGDKNLPDDPGARGLWLAGWAQPPVTTLYLVFGSIDVAGDRLALSGYLYDATGADLKAAHIFGQRYYAEMNEDGARLLAHDFSRDILEKLGLGPGLAGSRIYYVSRRAGSAEIWAMDYDGTNQKQLTFYKNLSLTPTISPDGTKLAFTTFVEGTPGIYIHSLETNRRLTFYNQVASLNTTPSFTPDGKSVVFASSATGYSQIYMADLNGGNLRRISFSRSLDVHPVVNPKTGAQVAFVSGRSGPPQVYLMDIDGANVRKLSPGGGDAVQPAWDPQGENLAFSWTRGFEPGNYNVFVMNVATQQLVQLTHGAGRNEHPAWSPSGTHIVFSSNRQGGTQIWSMRADGTQLRKLTSQGVNEMPMWGVR
jgi:TolB protein